MLKELYIENLAVIEKAVIPFSNNFNCFTGETGAGKSILINGINAVLGQRVTKDIVRTGCKKAIITALFSDLSEEVKTLLDELGISYDNDEITVTREINSDGGSNARINSRTASIAMLREIGELLITIHGQHDNQILLSPEKHINVLDSFGDTEQLIADYKNDFKKLQSLAKQLEKSKRSRVEKRDRIILLKSRIDDLKEVDITDEEYIELENEFRQIQNTDRIFKSLQVINVILSDENENNTIDMLSKCENELSGIAEYSNEFSQLFERLSTLKIELQDISDEIYSIADSFEIDSERAEYVVSKYNSLNNLQKKYGCDYSGLIRLYNEGRKELSEMEFSDEDLKKITEEKKKLLHQVTDKAKKISEHRKNISELFVRRVTEELRFLDMPNVVIEVKHDIGKLTINGMDSIEFLISANKGEKPKPIAKIASGGELSRIMLALKSVIADRDSVATMVFDEIDTGVSGKAAQKIGIKMKQISKDRQVICVTHLSQLAVMADNHLLIEKNTVENKTITNVIELDFNGRIKEIARIMGGENPSELILKSAEEELNKARNI